MNNPPSGLKLQVHTCLLVHSASPHLHTTYRLPTQHDSLHAADHSTQHRWPRRNAQYPTNASNMKLRPTYNDKCELSTCEEGNTWKSQVACSLAPNQMHSQLGARAYHPQISGTFVGLSCFLIGYEAACSIQDSLLRALDTIAVCASVQHMQSMQHSTKSRHPMLSSLQSQCACSYP